MNVNLTESEKNLLLQALYYYEDNKWFTNQNEAEKLIKKLNEVFYMEDIKKSATCDY
jgi:hypothetical protein